MADCELPRRAHRFPSSTLLMPAIAGDGQAITQDFAIFAAIFTACRHVAFASRMGAFVGFLFGHDPPLARSIAPPGAGRNGRRVI